MTTRSGSSPACARHGTLDGRAHSCIRCLAPRIAGRAFSRLGPEAATRTVLPAGQGLPVRGASRHTKFSMELRIQSLPAEIVVTRLPFSSCSTWRRARCAAREAAGNAAADGCHSSGRRPSMSSSAMFWRRNSSSERADPGCHVGQVRRGLSACTASE